MARRAALALLVWVPLVRLSAKQRRVILAATDSTAAVVISNGSVSSGKTWSTNLGWAAYLVTGPAGALAIIGKTRDTAARNIIDPLREQLPRGAVQYTRGADTATILGRPCHVLGANDARAEDRIRGLTLAGAYVDEATLLPKGYWDMLLTRLRVPGAKLFATTNPDHPRHPLKLETIDRATELGYDVFSFTIDDNPGLDPAYVARIKVSFAGLFYRRFILGEWVAATGAVYDMLDLGTDREPGSHRIGQTDVVLDPTRARVGIDYGTANATHAVLLIPGRRRQDGREGLVVAGEWTHSGRDTGRTLTDAQQSSALREWLATGAGVRGWSTTQRRLVTASAVTAARWLVDPSAASFKAQLRRDGVPGIREADNARLDGIRLTSSLLAADRLWFLADTSGDTVKPAAPVLEGQLVGYVWDDDPAVDAPADDQEDHGCDGLRYGAMGSRDVWRPWLTGRAAEPEVVAAEPVAPSERVHRAVARTRRG